MRVVSRSAAVDDDLLLALLNSTPVVGGRMTEGIDAQSGKEFAARFDGIGSPGELHQLHLMRRTLQDLVRGAEGATERLAALLADVSLVPEMSPAGIQWRLKTVEPKQLAARAAMAWSRLHESAPGRLRACANVDCNLFFIDHSRPGTGKWCSMTTCGNRMKVRAHASRQRTSHDPAS
jgi:predicted RNA-binding Zn ribbon-like protein